MADARSYTTRWRVRVYELDQNGHVNNAVYLNYAEQIASEHAESLGFGRAWMLAHGAGWVVRKHEVTYLLSAVYDDVLKLTTTVESLKGARGTRRTRIMRERDDALVAELLTEWVWVRLADGRPTRIPAELLAILAPA